MPEEDNNQEEETIEISKSDFKEIIQGQKKMQEELDDIKDGQAPDVMPDENQNDEITVHFLDGEPIIGFKDFSREGSDDVEYTYEKTDPNDPRKRDVYVTALVRNPDGDEPREVETQLVDLMRNSEKRDYEVLSKEVEPNTERQGEVVKKKVEGYRTVEQDIVVPVTVKSEDILYKVELENGEELKIHEDFINLG